MEAQEVLATDAVLEVRELLAWNENLDPSVFEVLTYDTEPAVVKILGNRPGVQASLKMSGRFVYQHLPNDFERMVPGLLRADASSLADGWVGSLAELVEAVHLVAR